MEHRTVRIGLIQTAVTEDPARNLTHTRDLVIRAAGEGATLICLQELFKLPYFPRFERADASGYAETIPGETTDHFSGLARELGVHLVVPLYELSGSGSYHNTAVMIDDHGEILPPYRKIHIPFDPFFYEKNYFRPGQEYRVYPTPAGKVGVLICYDQWFPEAARMLALMGAEIILYPTAIGRIRGMGEPEEGDWRIAWETIQRGHAIANGVHVAAVNRTGTEGELEFFGSSFICDAFGNVVARAAEDRDEVLVCDIDLSMNTRVREGWGFLRNRRPETYRLLGLPLGDKVISCPSCQIVPLEEPGILRMPAEWEEHEGVWLAWPYDQTTFPHLTDVETTYGEIIKALQGHEQVNLLVLNPGMEDLARKIISAAGGDPDRVAYHQTRYADVWFRDYGPLFVVNNSSGNLEMVHWVFNAWGEKYPDLMEDTNVPEYLANVLKIPQYSPGIVLEGGSIDLNGSGTALTTEQCLLNPNRNPMLSRPEIEEYLRRYLGARHIIWLKRGIAGDDTDGHVDDIARFVDSRTVVCALEENPGDPNFEPLMENYRVLKESADQDGNPLQVIPLPMPGAVTEEGMRYPASYLNFYIGNGVVLVPVFGDPNDGLALMVLEELFPGRTVVGIPSRRLVEGMGALHCITQQQPGQ
jgi:agmatine deiminase